MRDGDQPGLLGTAHGFGKVAVGILQHALGGTHRKHGVADILGIHTITDLDAKRLGELTIADHSGIAMVQSEGDGKHHISGGREEFIGRRSRGRPHTHAVAEAQIFGGEVAGAFLLAVPDLHAAHAGTDLLAIGSDILHHRCANGSGDSGQSLHAFQTEFDAEIHEIVPVAAGFGIDVYDSLAVLHRSGLVEHVDAAACVANDHTVERRVGHQHVGAAADYA